MAKIAVAHVTAELANRAEFFVMGSDKHGERVKTEEKGWGEKGKKMKKEKKGRKKEDTDQGWKGQKDGVG